MKKIKEFLKSENFKILLTIILFIFALFYAIFMAYHDETSKIENNYELVEIEKHERQNIKKANTTNNETISYFYNVQGDFLVFSSDVGDCYVRAFDSILTYNLIDNKLSNKNFDFSFDVVFDSLVFEQKYSETLYFNFVFSTDWKLITNFDYNFNFYFDETSTLPRLEFGISLRVYESDSTSHVLSDTKITSIPLDYISSWHDNSNIFTIDLTEILENFNTLYQNGYSKGFTTGQSVQKDLYEKSDTALNKIWTILENGIKTALNVLSIEILPGIPLTICVIVPLIFGIIFFIWKGGAQ